MCYNGIKQSFVSLQGQTNSKKISNYIQFGLKAETRLHEVGFSSNLISAKIRWIEQSQDYTLSVTGENKDPLEVLKLIQLLGAVKSIE